KTKQKLPKWFNGTLYSQGETVANPFTGEEIELTAVELSLYDFIMGCNMLFARGSNRVNDDMIKDFDRALTWFKINNPQAYMVLLD
ncbi:MAG: hypothetical protein GY777_24685, partial [Candidatus Brocadiaceae bacterium]|nr:hypothetical protein [Candidatus Brocadiaceae bacterium]